MGDLVQLGHRRVMVGLGEDRADDRGHRILGLLGYHGEQVPHEVHPAALPGGLVKDLRDRLTQALVGIGDHEPNTP